MGQRIRHFANFKLPNPFPLTPVCEHHYLQEKLQESKLGHLILLQHFMGQRIRHFVNCKLPNQFPLTPVNKIFKINSTFEKIANTTDFYGSKAYIFCPKTPQPIFTDPSQHHHLEEKLQKSLTKQYHSCFH